MTDDYDVEEARRTVSGTSKKAGREARAKLPPLTPERQAKVDEANALMQKAYEIMQDAALREEMPVGRVKWMHVSQVQANEYNPNAVASDEMRLLHTSIKEDGYTMPVVAIWDDEIQKAVIVDGFHRYTTMRVFQDIANATSGYLPIAFIEKSIEDRIASTVRHNRARGKHSVSGMGNLVFQLLEQGLSDTEICRRIGVDAEELVRLKHVTGYSKLYKDQEFSQMTQTGSQMKAKAEYKKEHPDAVIPQF